MKIVNYDRNLLNKLSDLKYLKPFLDNYEIPKTEIDLVALNAVMSNLTLESLNSFSEKTIENERNIFSWDSVISYNFSKISNISKGSGFCKVNDSFAKLEEFFFWDKFSKSEYRTDVLIDFLNTKNKGSWSCPNYIFEEESIVKLMSDLIFHLNDIDGNGSLEIIKSYL